MNQLRKKPWASNLPVRIIFALYQSKNPMSLSMISQICKSPRQKVNYHLITLVSKGLILYNDQDKKYRIQPCLRDKSFIEKLEPLVSSITAAIVTGKQGL